MSRNNIPLAATVFITVFGLLGAFTFAGPASAQQQFPVTNLVATPASSSGIIVSWTPLPVSTGVGSYVIVHLRCVAIGNCPDGLPGVVVSGPPYADIGLAPNTLYRYDVRARSVKTGATLGISTVVYARTLPIAPPTGSITGPASGTVGQSLTYTATGNDADANLQKIEIWASSAPGNPFGFTKRADCPITPAASGRCTATFSLPAPGQYNVVVVAYDNTGYQCNGNPGRPVLPSVVDCGLSDLINIRVNSIATPPPPPATPPSPQPIPMPPPAPVSRPDVIVTSISYANGMFESIIKNQGTLATPAGIAIGIGYSVDGIFRTWGARLNSPLSPGASATVGTNGGTYIIPAGTHTIRAWVDDVNRFAESNETNNQLFKTITIGSIAPPSSPPPNPTPPPGSVPLSISMTVACAPHCPLNGTITPVNVSVLSGDPIGMSFSRDGLPVFLTCPGSGQCYAPPSWGFNWCITISCWHGISGQHTLNVTARDAAGQTATAVVTMNVSDTPSPANPTPPPGTNPISITAPANGAIVSGASVRVSAASNSAHIAYVDFKVDGMLLYTDQGAPYEMIWNTIGATNSSHALTAVARDIAGNITTSPSVMVTVNNGRTLSPSTGLPDLIVTSISYASGVFTATVKNQGTGANPAADIGVAFRVDGIYQTWGAADVTSIPAGNSVTINSSGGGPYVIPAGTHTVMAWADDNNRVLESNNNNNTLTRTMTN